MVGRRLGSFRTAPTKGCALVGVSAVDREHPESKDIQQKINNAKKTG
jgi:hypothetical protein